MFDVFFSISSIITLADSVNDPILFMGCRHTPKGGVVAIYILSNGDSLINKLLREFGEYVPEAKVTFHPVDEIGGRTLTINY